jgi:hypothetical protein
VSVQRQVDDKHIHEFDHKGMASIIRCEVSAECSKTLLWVAAVPYVLTKEMPKCLQKRVVPVLGIQDSSIFAATP